MLNAYHNYQIELCDSQKSGHDSCADVIGDVLIGVNSILLYAHRVTIGSEA